MSAIGVVNIRIPIPGQNYIKYESFLISRNVPMLFGLSDQRRFKCTTIKDDDGPQFIVFRTLGLQLLLTFRLGHLYFIVDGDCSVLFTSAEIAQVYANLGHAPAGSEYSALRRAYPTETKAL